MESVDRTCRMRYCVNCNDEACYPFDWDEDGPNHWIVLLRCGNCDMYREGRFHQLEVEDFDVWLDECADEINDALKVLANFNAEQEVEKFAKMLEHDVIMPEDFN